MSEEIEQALHRKVSELCERGDAHVEAGELDRAVERYEEALSLLPRPLHQWHAATWILTALGETLYFQKQHQEAVSALLEALRCPRGLGNPLVHLRLGQAALGLGDDSLAREHLARAYLAAAEEVFQGEDPRHLEIAREAAGARLESAQAHVDEVALGDASREP
ncbi:tetratricopeptide repeat protein [Chondromyces crocatus]|uniref:tetratricopeptide repeat protein n=1 Tax=Chondromyces crocatus TaxID=52 RepID=UPI0012E16497|nr:tetratricopeptide repeat protein [Chondromyces crocatus]